MAWLLILIAILMLVEWLVRQKVKIMVASNLQFHPDSAFVVAEKHITREQFFADISAFQHKLAGLKPTSHVVLFHPDTYQFAVRLFAPARSGHNVILPPNGQPETLRLLLAQSPIFAGDARELDTGIVFNNLELSQQHITAVCHAYSGQRKPPLFFILRALQVNLSR